MSNDTWRYSDTIADRLWSGLAVREDGCIEWVRSVNPGGYGRITRGARGAGYALTHRVSWELVNGPVPDGSYVLHACDNPPCCNPDHLWLGSLSDNTQDMVAKGRSRTATGVAHRDAKLTWDEVQRLRALAAQLGNYAAAGRAFGVTKQHARAICLGTVRRAA